MELIESSVKGTLIKEEERLLIKTVKGKIFAVSSKIPFAINYNAKELTRIVVKNSKTGLMFVNKPHTSLLVNELRLKRGYIDMDNSSLIINNKMLDKKIGLIVHKETIIIVKIDIDLIDKLQSELLDYIVESTENKIGLLQTLPITTVTQRRISDLFISKDSKDEEYSSDIAMKITPNTASLIKFLGMISPDRPSRSLIASPDTTTWTLSTLGLPIIAKGYKGTIFQVNDIKTKMQWLPDAVATYHHQLWETYDEDEKMSINVKGVFWNDRNRTSTDMSYEDVETVSNIIMNTTEKIIRTVTIDVTNMFANIANGYKGVLLPTLLKGVEFPYLTLKEQYKGRKPIQVVWNLPSCTAMCRLSISNDPKQSVMSVLVSISPPITHNYIASNMALTVTQCNEYNEQMCQRIEYESENIIEHIYDKFEFLSAYLTYYGTYAEGMRMLGIDPVQNLLDNMSVIEQGVNAKISIEGLKRTFSLPVKVYIGTYFRKTLQNSNMQTVLLRRVKDGCILLSHEIHEVLNIVFKEAHNYNRTEVYFAISHIQHLLGIKNLVYHAINCYKVKVQKPYGPAELTSAIMSTKPIVADCVQPMVVDIPEIRRHGVTESEGSSMSMIAYNTRVTMEQQGNIISTFNPSTVRIYQVSNSIPSVGRCAIIKIVSMNNKLKNSRVNNVITILDSYASVQYELSTIKEKNISEVIDKIRENIKQASVNNQNVLIIAYDMFPSLLKQTNMYNELAITVPKKMKIFIPDGLLYNVLKRKILIDKELELTKGEIKQIEMTKEGEDPLTASSNPSEGTMDLTKFLDTHRNMVVALLSLVLLTVAFVYGWNYVKLVFLWPGKMFLKTMQKKKSLYDLGNLFNVVKQRPWVRPLTWTLNVVWWGTLMGLLRGVATAASNV